jgi:hypothetical protein
MIFAGETEVLGENLPSATLSGNKYHAKNTERLLNASKEVVLK